MKQTEVTTGTPRAEFRHASRDEGSPPRSSVSRKMVSLTIHLENAAKTNDKKPYFHEVTSARHGLMDLLDVHEHVQMTCLPPLLQQCPASDTDENSSPLYWLSEKGRLFPFLNWLLVRTFSLSFRVIYMWLTLPLLRYLANINRHSLNTFSARCCLEHHRQGWTKQTRCLLLWSSTCHQRNQKIKMSKWTR